MTAFPEAPRRDCDVLHVVWSGKIGGIERQLEVVTRAAADGCHRHVVCFLDGRGPIGDALEADGLAHRLGCRAGWDVRGLWRLVRLLRRLRPRVIHVHTHAVASVLVVLAALPRATRVYTEHSPRLLERDRKFDLLYRLLRATFARFVAISPAMAVAMERRGVRRERIVELPYALSAPLRDHVPAAGVARTIGTVARLDEVKRLGLFLDVVAELCRRGAACSAVVVGDGSERASLERQARSLGIGSRVRFVGEQRDVTPWLDRFDTFLVTSRVETFGLAALEAMARGVPVVAMACEGGIVDLVGRGGVLLPDRDVAAAADAVAALHASPDAASAVAARGHAVTAEHAPEAVLGRHERLYEEVELERGKLRRPLLAGPT